MSASLVVRRHDGHETLDLREPILRVYGASHAEPIQREPWLAEEQFWQRLVELYAPGRGFEMVSGWLGHDMIGYAFGSPRDGMPTTPVWEQVKAAASDFPIRDMTESIYIFREFAVHPEHQSKGHGRELHNALLTGRPERLACLAVRVDNKQAAGAYLAWGWRRVGTIQPFPDSPVLDQMVHPLPL